MRIITRALCVAAGWMPARAVHDARGTALTKRRARTADHLRTKHTIQYEVQMYTSPDFNEYEAKSSAFAALRAQIFPDNKRMLFEVLASAGIDTVVVEFDGCGDSGQIEFCIGVHRGQ